jgi:hypothetical protein
MSAPRLRITGIELFERDVRLRLPFRFGVTTLEAAPQAFAQVRVRLEDGRERAGMAAEVLAPKWFDKNLALSNEDNFEQLRVSTRLAAGAYLAAGSSTPFGLFAGNYRGHVAVCAARDLNPLIAGFGPALLDRAVLDAVCRLQGVSVFEAVAANLPGIEAGFFPDLAGFDIAAFLASLRPQKAIHARHTVGLVDPITAADLPDDKRVNDGLPETLEESIAFYGCRYFKLKVGGKLEEDLARLEAIAAVLDRIEQPYFATLDGNEQYESGEALALLVAAMEASARLRRLVASILFIEQPIGRAHALETDVRALAAKRPLIIDESDAALDAFVVAKGLGYTGISTKSCKGLYRSLLNAARCARWNREEGAGRYFMSAEDLTTQAGLGVQQDLALATLVGCDHVERNGHHYVNGMAALPAAEQAAFLGAHPDLYHRQDGVVRLHIQDGRIAMGSLFQPGFAHAADPDLAAMRAIPLEA